MEVNEGEDEFPDRANSRCHGKIAVSKYGAGKEKGEARWRELARGLPLEWLRIETDGPCVCGQTAYPGHVPQAAEKTAEWKECSLLGEVMEATRRSPFSVFKI